MKKLLTLLLLTLFIYSGQASSNITKSELLRKIERIEKTSQELTTLYLYVSQRLSVTISEKGLAESIRFLKNDINSLYLGSDSEQKALVEFMQFTYQELHTLVKQPFNVENASLIIDYCESLLEAAEYIKDVNTPEPDNIDLQMMVISQEMEYLIERANRYYIAFRVGIKDDNSIQQMQDTIHSFDQKLKFINTYKYTNQAQKDSLATLNRYWARSRKFYQGIEQNNLPRVVLASTKYLQSSLDKLSQFHFVKSRK